MLTGGWTGIDRLVTPSARGARTPLPTVPAWAHRPPQVFLCRPLSTAEVHRLRGAGDAIARLGAPDSTGGPVQTRCARPRDTGARRGAGDAIARRRHHLRGHRQEAGNPRRGGQPAGPAPATSPTAGPTCWSRARVLTSSRPPGWGRRRAGPPPTGGHDRERRHGAIRAPRPDLSARRRRGGRYPERGGAPGSRTPESVPGSVSPVLGSWSPGVLGSWGPGRPSTGRRREPVGSASAPSSSSGTHRKRRRGTHGGRRSVRRPPQSSPRHRVMAALGLRLDGGRPVV